MQGIVSVIIVNYNGMKYLDACLDSLSQVDTGPRQLEVILVDNQSSDGSREHVQKRHPAVKVIRNDVNNYARALNIGIAHACGAEVALLNNDTIVDKKWLVGLLDILHQDKRNGAVQSKILFPDGKTINSAGVIEIEDFYFQDRGFGETDSGQYEDAVEMDYVTGGSVIFRRECLDDVGMFDDTFIMYFEDIEYSIRCRQKGWRLLYSPSSLVNHAFHGTATTELCEHFCSRNRLLLLAKHYPHRLVDCIMTSHDYLNGRRDRLYWSLIQSVKALVESHDADTAESVLGKVKRTIVGIFGARTAIAFFSHLEVALGLRRIRLGIYDHALHFAGGGQRYVAKVAESLQDRYEITYIANKDVSLKRYQEWFGIDLSRCRLKIIRMPEYENRGGPFIDESLARNMADNPFELVSEESAYYDLFLNANMLTAVEPLSPLSIFMCHFPDQKKGRYFKVHRYDYLLANGRYTSSWIKNKWGLTSTAILYPPVDMYHLASAPNNKDNIILSVARFEIGGSKKQIEMVEAFQKLFRGHEGVAREWRLILAGGSHGHNVYLEKLRTFVEATGLSNIVVMPNLSNDDIKDLYRRAAIFWHACGLDETQPHLVEHFGMTTVEAMQNYCVPIVIDGGGQREIVEHGKSGFRFSSVEQLQKYTLDVIQDRVLRERVARYAYERSQLFNEKVFRTRLLSFIENVEGRLRGGESVDAWLS